jgi:deoxyribonuclease V
VELRELNRWNLSPGEARAVQLALAPRVVRSGEPGEVRVAGIDVALPGDEARAAVVVDGYPELTPLETALAEQPLTFPYVPGLLSFREAPAVVAALRQVREPPDLVVVDGQGIAHPRRLGIASHVGLILDLPTIGCAKSLLVGRHEPVGPERGDWQPIYQGDEVIGAAIRTRPGAKPVYASIGHRIGFEAMVRWVLELSRGYRLPIPQRQAHLAAGSAP